MSKKIISLFLSLILVLGSTVAFAADFDLKNKTTGTVTPLDDVLLNDDLFLEVAFDKKNYTVEFEGKLYNLVDVQAKFDADPTLTMEEAVSGLTPVGEEALKVESVSAINARQFKIVYNKPVASTGDHSALNLNNYYIGLADEVKQTNFTAINARTGGSITSTGNWTPAFADKAKTTVIITSDKADENILVKDPTKTKIGIQEGKYFTFEVRNVYDADGKGMSTVQKTLKAEDVTRPTVEMAKGDINTGATSVKVLFSEPVMAATQGTNANLEAAATVYLDNAPIALTNTAITDSSDTFDKAREVTITVPALTKGTHKLSFVGVKDVAGNVITPNPTTLTFEVKDGTTTTKTKPTLLAIKQVDDNAFVLVFDKAIDMNAAAGPLGVGKVTIENADGQNGAKVVDLASLGTDTFVAAPAKYDELVEEVDEDAVGYLMTLVKAINGFQANELSFNNANALLRKFVVEDFETDDEAAGTKNGLVMDKKEMTIEIKKDITAPTLADQEVAANNKGFDLTFVDGPFDKDIDLVGGKKVIVKATVDGITYVDEVTPTMAASPVVNVTLTAGTKLVDAVKNELLPNTTYTLILPDNLVNDKAESSSQGTYVDGTAIPIGDHLDPARPHAFVGKTITITTDGTGSVTEVPQLSQAEADVYNGTVPATNVKNVVKLEIFGKNIDPATVSNIANYKIDGVAMPAGTSAYYTEDTVANKNYIVIELPDNSIELDGLYNLNISNIATKEGYKMLPVTVKVKLEDNTGAKLESATITSTNTLKLKFDEGIAAITDKAAAGRNFIVTVNGTPYEVLSAEVDTVDQYINIVTSSNFDMNGTVKVSTKLDNNGNVNVYDQATKANKIVTGVEVTAVKATDL